MARIGLLGGTFDPPHVGHAVVAACVAAALHLDEVRLVVANEPWQKVGSRQITSAERRLAMTQAAVSHWQGEAPCRLVASNVELELGGSSYTAVTLEHLRRQEPEANFIVIVGADAATGLDTWHEADRLRRTAHFAVVNRPGYDDAPPSDGFWHELVAMPPLDVSSTDLRDRMGRGEPVNFVVPGAVIDLAAAWGLYRPAM